MNLDLNLTFILSTAITSAINGATTFLVIRYLNKGVDHLDKISKKKEK